MGRFIDSIIPTSSACTDPRSRALKAKKTGSIQIYKIRAGKVHLQVVSHSNCLTNISPLSPFSRDPGKFSAPLKITSVFYCWERISVFTNPRFLIFTEADAGLPQNLRNWQAKLTRLSHLLLKKYLLWVYSTCRSRGPSTLQISCTFQWSAVGRAMVWTSEIGTDELCSRYIQNKWAKTPVLIYEPWYGRACSSHLWGPSSPPLC